MSRVVPSGSSATPSATPRKEERQVLRILAVGDEGGGRGGRRGAAHARGVRRVVACGARGAPAVRGGLVGQRTGAPPPRGPARRRSGLAGDPARAAPLADAVEQAPAAAALSAHGENPQHLPLLLTRCGGRSRGRAARYHSAHALPDPPPA